jgi:hypothetical protein
VVFAFPFEDKIPLWRSQYKTMKRDNHMKKSIALCLIFMCGVMPALSKSNFESVPPGNWAKLKSLPLGAEISVKMMFGDKMNGEYMGLDAEAIHINIDGQKKTFPSRDVAEIRLREVRDPNNNGTLIGLAIGGGAAAFLLAIGYAEAEYYAVYVPTWAGIGALIGYVSDNLHKGSELIYRAPDNK